MRHGLQTPRISSLETTSVAKDKEVVIAVMGATGCGKTTFINLLSKSTLSVGRGLQSCTNVVQAATPFVLDGRQVLLIDTPGFDDTTKSDSDILKMIAHFLSTTYQQGIRLSGVIYMHRISDFRMGGIAMRNFSIFRQLCGEEIFQNVAIVTSMWSEVSASVGDAREAELRDQEMFFKPVLAQGARLFRHDKNLESAQTIVRSLVRSRPIALRIQRELVDQALELSETAAGLELNRDLIAQVRKHREELQNLQIEMRAAMQARDEETRRELEEESRKLQAEMARLQTDSRKLLVDYNEEKVRMERQIQAMAETTRLEVERATEECRQQMNDLQRRFQSTANTSAVERSAIQLQMQTLQRALEARAASSGSGGGILGSIGWVIGIVLHFL